MSQESEPQVGMTSEQRRRRFISTDEDVEVAAATQPTEPSPVRDLILDGTEGVDIYRDRERYERERDRALRQFDPE